MVEEAGTPGCAGLLAARLCGAGVLTHLDDLEALGQARHRLPRLRRGEVVVVLLGEVVAVLLVPGHGQSAASLAGCAQRRDRRPDQSAVDLLRFLDAKVALLDGLEQRVHAGRHGRL